MRQRTAHLQKRFLKRRLSSKLAELPSKPDQRRMSCAGVHITCAEATASAFVSVNPTRGQNHPLLDVPYTLTRFSVQHRPVQQDERCAGILNLCKDHCLRFSERLRLFMLTHHINSDGRRGEYQMVKSPVGVMQGQMWQRLPDRFTV